MPRLVYLDHADFKVKMYVSSEQERRLRAGACAKEPETVHWLMETFGKDDCLYDIGANVGSYSLLANAIAGGNASIIAFEPAALTFARLVENILLNFAQDRIVPLPVALGQSTRIERLFYSDLMPGMALHRVGEAIDQFGKALDLSRSHQCLQFALDDLLETIWIPVPTHLKIDVDGTELPVLKGMRGLLRYVGVRTIMVETMPKTPEQVAIIKLAQEAWFSLMGRFPHASGVENLRFDRPKGFQVPEPPSPYADE